MAINSHSLRLQDLLEWLSARYPELAGECFTLAQDKCFQRGFIANVDGERFVDNADALLPAGSTVLILSSDAGG